MKMAFALAAAAPALLLAGCASTPPPAAPVSHEAPPPLPEAPPPSPPPPAPAGWEDQPLSGGDWRFVAGPPAAAEYGEPAAALFTIRCDSARRRLLLTRADTPGPLTLRTTFGARTLAAGEGGAASLPAGDAFLDWLLFSRGRFAVEAEGRPALILPTWPEPARVVEECR